MCCVSTQQELAFMRIAFINILCWLMDMVLFLDLFSFLWSLHLDLFFLIIFINMYHVMNIHHSLPKASFHNENSLLSFIRGSFCQTKRIPHLHALNLPSNEWSELVFSPIHFFEQRSLSQNDYSHHNYSKTKSKHTIGISSFYSLSSSHTLTIQ